MKNVTLAEDTRRDPRRIATVVGVILLSVGVLSVLTGLVLVGYNLWDDARAGSELGPVLSVMHKTLPQSVIITDGDSDEPSEPEIPTDDETSPDAPEIPDYILDPNMAMPTIEIDGRRYIGTVEIPALDLELPILEQWTVKNLKIAPVHYVGTPYLHNMIIAGHNYTSHFGRLKNLEKGDLVFFTDVDGNIFRYRVSKLETLGSYDVEEMKSGEWDLTLFTCTIGGVYRVTVRCVAD